MLKRLLALSAVPVLLIASIAIAGQLPLSSQLLTAAGITVSGAIPADALTFDDPAGDVYHPLGEPGLTDGSIDITRVEMTAWAIGIAGALEDKNPFAMEFGADGIKRGGPAGDFESGSPYVVAEFHLGGNPSMFATRFCEFPLAWANPTRDVFQGIEGDLFNGTNTVAVARIGNGVPDGFQVRSSQYVDGLWSEMGPIGYSAYSGSRVAFAIPADAFGPPAEGLLSIVRNFARGGGGATDSSLDFNFGSFCSEGGQTFVASEGGADILQTPVDLAMLPVTVLGAPEAPAPSTTEAPPATATPTTLDDTPVTSVPPDEEEKPGGGLSPAALALIAGGIAAAVYGAVRFARGKSEDDSKRPPGFSVRLDLDSGVTGSFADVSGLPFEQPPIDYRDGMSKDGSRIKQPGIPKHADIVLKRGFVSDAGEAFDAWRSGAELGGGSVGLFLDGEPTVRWTWDRSWATRVDGPGLKSTGNEVAMESLEMKVENPRFEAGR